MDESRHTISLDNREKLALTGVTDILSFDEENIVAQTTNEILIITGSNLHIISLNLDKGTLVAAGNVTSLTYDTGISSKKSFLGKIFR